MADGAVELDESRLDRSSEMRGRPSGMLPDGTVVLRPEVFAQWLADGWIDRHGRYTYKFREACRAGWGDNADG